MLRRFAAVLLMVSLCGPAFAQGVLGASMAAVRANDWDGAARAVRGQSAVAQDVVEWHRLRAGVGSAQEALRFLERRGDWPGLPYLRKQMEPAFSKASDARIMAFFAGQSVQTGEGALAYAGALRRAGRRGEAEAEIVQAWRSLALSDSTQAAFLDRYGRLLQDHHVARLDMALWKGWRENALRLYPLVSEGQQKLAAARLALRRDLDGVDAYIAAVPSALANDPGLAFERFSWRARKGRNASAIELLLAQSQAERLGEAGSWAGWRRALARSEMRAGRHRQAYAVATRHGLTEGSAYADLEWLAGYLAVRFLNSPGVALQHFVRFEQAVETPISFGRAGYWIGRAYDGMGEREAAQRAYAGGGQYQTTFYGLLAAEKAGLPIKPELAGTSAPSWRGAPYTQTSVHQAAVLLLNSAELSLAERFWTHLAESQDPATMAQMGQMAIEINEPHIAIMLGKRFAQYGQTVHAPYYALHPLAERRDLPVPTEMVLSIARRESEFDPSVVSGANAQGLMQILPGTAQDVTKELGLPYSKARLLSDPMYNVTLGSAYLKGLADQFDGNVIMVSAGYNAGPRRPLRWMETNGDPRRRGGMDIVDWIEHIPFNETRNYVMRVSESLPIYRARLGKTALPVPFSQELIGSSLR